MTKSPKSAGRTEKPLSSQEPADGRQDDTATAVDSVVDQTAETSQIGDVARGDEAENRIEKSEKRTPTDEVPHPTQAELDAIKEGRYRSRDMQAERGAAYKTR